MNSKTATRLATARKELGLGKANRSIRFGKGGRVEGVSSTPETIRCRTHKDKGERKYGTPCPHCR